MPESKDKNTHDDIKFNRGDLTSDDAEVAVAAREKLNSPIPTEEGRAKPEAFSSWPIPEDRKPAVMRADQADSLDYKIETYEKVPEDARALEVDQGTGEAARREFARISNEELDANKIQAPPTVAAQQVADGEGGMINQGTPILDRQGNRTDAAAAPVRPAATTAARTNNKK